MWSLPAVWSPHVNHISPVNKITTNTPHLQLTQMYKQCN